MAVKISKGRISMTVYLEPATYAEIKAHATRLMPEVSSWEAPFLRNVLKGWLRAQKTGISHEQFDKMIESRILFKGCPVVGCRDLRPHSHDQKEKAKASR